MHRRPFFRKNYDKSALNEGIWICHPCHRGIHRLFDEMTLAKQLNSLEKLRADEAIQRHIMWVSKQKSGRYNPSHSC